MRLCMKRFLASATLIVSLAFPATAAAASWWEWVPRLFSLERQEEEPVSQFCKVRNSWGRCIVLSMPGSGTTDLPRQNLYKVVSSYEHLMTDIALDVPADAQ